VNVKIYPPPPVNACRRPRRPDSPPQKATPGASLLPVAAMIDVERIAVGVIDVVVISLIAGAGVLVVVSFPVVSLVSVSETSFFPGNSGV